MATRKQVNTYAYREARDAGLDVNTSRAVADRVLERVFLGGETLELATRDEIQKHANP